MNSKHSDNDTSSSIISENAQHVWAGRIRRIGCTAALVGLAFVSFTGLPAQASAAPVSAKTATVTQQRTATAAPATAAPASTAKAPTRAQREHNIALAVLHAINQERHANGRAALTMNAQLVTSARGHSNLMARYDTMSHQLPGEAYFADRIEQAGYNWRTAGENIAWNSVVSKAGALALESIMYNEQAPNNGHRVNILNPSYRNAGVDIVMDPVHHRIWLTVDFGSHM